MKRTIKKHLINFLAMSLISLTANSLSAAQKPITRPGAERMSGVAYVYRPEILWAGSKSQGMSPPLPFSIETNTGGDLRVFVNQSLDVTNLNPQTNGYYQKGDATFYFFTGFPQSNATGKISDQISALGDIRDGREIYDNYSSPLVEIITLSLDKKLVAAGIEKLSKLQLFQTLRTNPDWIARLETINSTPSANQVEYRIWIKSGVTQAEWCGYRLSIAYDGNSHPIETYFEQRARNTEAGPLDPLYNSALWVSYKVVTQKIETVDSISTAALKEEMRAADIEITDRRKAVNGGRGLRYKIGILDPVPFDMNSGIISSAAKKADRDAMQKAKASGNATMAFGIAIIASGIFASVYWGKLKQQPKQVKINT